MYKLKAVFFLTFFFSVTALSAQSDKEDPNLRLWYDQPAGIWEEALPLGNGKTGAMVFGGVKKALFQLNDNTLWSGFPDPGNNKNGQKYLPLLRKAVFEGDYEQAAKYWKKMQGPYSARYLPLGDLFIDFTLQDTIPSSYNRALDLNNAVSAVGYEIDGVNYTREAFISYPDQVMVVRITADKNNSINFNTGLSSKLRYDVSAKAEDYLILAGKAPKFVAHRGSVPEQIVYDEKPDGEGMNFEIHLKIQTEGGRVESDGNSLKVSDADTVIIYLTEATSFNGFDKSPGLEGKDPSREAIANMDKATGKSYEELKRSHIADYQNLFKRVFFDLGLDKKAVSLPTNKRLVRFNEDKPDNQLQALYYQFGRYLLISSSRTGSVPANLQGIWNPHVQPPWGSNYTMNINTEMNYWLAENTNLSECHIPLFNFIENLSKNGAKTAQVNYGIDQGWTAHHNSDVWAKTSPTGGYEWDPKGAARWAAWPMSGAWLSTHLWEHYLYTSDKQFLQEQAYPLMKGAAAFMLEWLIEDENGYLVTNPSTSPENEFGIDGNKYEISVASTMDMAIIREIFNDCIRAGEVLGNDKDFQEELKKAKAKLYPYHIGQYGQLQEWFKDWDDPEDNHRHLSHLFGLFPGGHITVNHTPKLAAAAKQSLLHRGDESTGWSMAWKINWWARLKDGNHAYKILESGLNYINPSQNEVQMSGGGTYPNLFDAHPPFQIDGNFGGTAGITEMLMQSHAGEISLLPALPDEWPIGSIKGIKARGNFTIDLNWKNTRLVQAKIYSGTGGNCRLRTNIPVKVVEVSYKKAEGPNPNPLTRKSEAPEFRNNAKGDLPDLDVEEGHVIDFITEEGKSYTIVPL